MSPVSLYPAVFLVSQNQHEYEVHCGSAYSTTRNSNYQLLPSITSLLFPGRVEEEDRGAGLARQGATEPQDLVLGLPFRFPLCLEFLLL